MNQELINSIIYYMNTYLDNQQLMQLKIVLENVMNSENMEEDNSLKKKLYYQKRKKEPCPYCKGVRRKMHHFL